ncbi:MAG: flagellar hook-length control protein FliK [Magnetococcales bacterium]|nr:flagellar hook-length control protein FliK [Magnetococcales bacterium]
MTLLKMSIPQVEMRPPASAERTTVTRSAEEASARHFEKALQRAEARKSAAGQDESQTESARSRSEVEESEKNAANVSEARETRASGEAREARVSQESREVREAREAREARDVESESEAAGQTTESAETTACAGMTGEKPLQESAGSPGKPRSNRKKGDEMWLALPHGALIVPVEGHVAALSGTPTTEGTASPGSANIPSLPGQGVAPGQPNPTGQAPASPGPSPVHEFAVPPSPAQRLAETMGARGMTRPEVSHLQALTSGDDKNDFAFAMRLVSDGSPTAPGKPGLTSQTPLSANSPTFADDLADEVGRLRVISRPGGAEQVRISLHPRDLGGLDMRLVVDDERQVHLMITTESEATRDILNRQMPQLREALARQNLEMGEVIVHVDDGSGGGNAPEWGFQGGNPADDERQQSQIWWGGRGSDRGELSMESLRSPPVASSGGAAGLSLFA